MTDPRNYYNISKYYLKTTIKPTTTKGEERLNAISFLTGQFFIIHKTMVLLKKRTSC